MMSDDISRLKEAEKAANYTKEESCVSTNSHWMPGAVLILLGTIFLFTTMTNFSFNNWWALFILIPAVANFGHALERWGRHGRFSHSVRGSFTAGCVLTLIALAFLLDLNWDLIWPSILIVLGISALLSGLLR